jgi:hypothetical protein
MNDAESEIREIVDRETRGWDTQDVGLLLSVFHPDMVWPWPNSPTSHDPMEWRLVPRPGQLLRTPLWRSSVCPILTVLRA